MANFTEPGKLYYYLEGFFDFPKKLQCVGRLGNKHFIYIKSQQSQYGLYLNKPKAIVKCMTAAPLWQIHFVVIGNFNFFSYLTI